MKLTVLGASGRAGGRATNPSVAPHTHSPCLVFQVAEDQASQGREDLRRWEGGGWAHARAHSPRPIVRSETGRGRGRGGTLAMGLAPVGSSGPTSVGAQSICGDGDGADMCVRTHGGPWGVVRHTSLGWAAIALEGGGCVVAELPESAV